MWETKPADRGWLTRSTSCNKPRKTRLVSRAWRFLALLYKYLYFPQHVFNGGLSGISLHCDAVQYYPSHPGQTSTNIWLFDLVGNSINAAVTTLQQTRVCGWSDLYVWPCFQWKQLTQKLPPLRNFASLQPLSLHAEVENMENRVQKPRLPLASKLLPLASELLPLASELPPGHSNISTVFSDIKNRWNLKRCTRSTIIYTSRWWEWT